MLEMGSAAQGGRRPSEGARDLRLFQDHHPRHHHHHHLYSAGGSFMDVTTSAAGNNINTGGRGANAFPVKKMMNGTTTEDKRTEYRRSLSQQGKKVFSGSSGYLSFQGLFLLVCLTASLLLLPLVLPPLPPPPFLLLLLPICIMGLLMVLAFMPYNARDASYAYL